MSLTSLALAISVCRAGAGELTKMTISAVVTFRRLLQNTARFFGSVSCAMPITMSFFEFEEEVA
jgi:hypothetical protein